MQISARVVGRSFFLLSTESLVEGCFQRRIGVWDCATIQAFAFVSDRELYVLCLPASTCFCKKSRCCGCHNGKFVFASKRKPDPTKSWHLLRFSTMILNFSLWVACSLLLIFWVDLKKDHPTRRNLFLRIKESESGMILIGVKADAHQIRT